MDKVIICDECTERASFLDNDPTDAGAASVPHSGGKVSLFTLRMLHSYLPTVLKKRSQNCGQSA